MIKFKKTVLYRDLGFFLHYCGCFFKDVTAVSCSASMSYEENAAFLHILFFVFYCIKRFLLLRGCGICLLRIHMRFDMSKILEILYTSYVMCLSDIHVRYLRE